MLALHPPELVELLATLPPSRTPFIWGPPGIGKSALVREAAARSGMPCVTLLGTQLAPEDLIGVPRVRRLDGDAERWVTEFCPPRAILRSEPFLLFVDELNSAVPDVQKAFYSLILDRRLGDYELPEASRVVGAGNRIEDRALVRPMATALGNRMLHVALEPSAAAWLDWGSKNGIHALVLAFVRARPDRLCEPAPSDATPAYPTPRAWHMLSDALVSVAAELWPALAAGSVGDRAGAEFSAFAKRALAAPRLEDLAAGRAPAPADPDLVYFLGACCVSKLASDRAEDGLLAARALELLAAVSMEVAVWTVDAALRRTERSAAAEAFEGHVRSGGSSVLVDVLRLGRFGREERAGEGRAPATRRLGSTGA
jgi:MoxR-like ATPase